MRAARLGDVVRSMKNGLYKPASDYADDGTPCLRMYNIEAGSIVWRDVKRMRVSDAEREEYGLREGDLLVNRVNSRELVGKAALIPPSLEASVFESKNIRVRLDASKAVPKFINYQLLAGGRSHFAGNAQQVVGMASISQKQLADFPIVLGHLDEQHRIVAEIEKQFSRLDEAVAGLRRVKTNLQHYKAAMLTRATDGRLVEGGGYAAHKIEDVGGGAGLRAKILKARMTTWQSGELGRRKYIPPPGPEAGRLASVPSHWEWATIEELGPADRPCAYGVLQPGDDQEEGVPFVRVGDIADGRIDKQSLKRIDPKIAARYPRTQLEGGELLVTLVGTVGRTAIVPLELRGANVARAVAVVPLTPLVNTRWVELWFRSPRRVRAMNAEAHEVARKTLNLEDVRRAVVALPPITEQSQIVEVVEYQLSVVEALERDVEAGLKHAKVLRLSILARAFGRQAERRAR